MSGFEMLRISSGMEKGIYPLHSERRWVGHLVMHAG